MNSEILKKIEMISGIDSAKGLALCAGNEKVYEKALSLLYSKAEQTINNIREHYANDLKTYVIEVHGIKSSLANVGADALSKKAYDLEMAYKDSNMDFTDDHIEGFLNDFESLTNLVKSAFEGDIQQKTKGDDQMLARELTRLKDAIAEYEFGVCDEVFEILLKYDFGTESAERIARMKSFADNFDMDEVAEIITNEFGL